MRLDSKRCPGADGGRSARVLVVDEEAAMWGALRRVLDDAGFIVWTARSVDEAVDVARDWRPASILIGLEAAGVASFVVALRRAIVGTLPRMVVLGGPGAVVIEQAAAYDADTFEVQELIDLLDPGSTRSDAPQHH